MLTTGARGHDGPGQLRRVMRHTVVPPALWMCRKNHGLAASVLFDEDAGAPSAM